MFWMASSGFAVRGLCHWFPSAVGLREGVSPRSAVAGFLGLAWPRLPVPVRGGVGGWPAPGGLRCALPGLGAEEPEHVGVGEPAAAALFTDRAWHIADVLAQVAQETGRSPAQVALSWVTRRSGVTSTLTGVTSVEQLEENLQAREFEIPPELAARLGEASRPEPAYPYYFFGPAAQPMINAGTVVQTLPTTDRLVPYGADPASGLSESS
jgi:hypothetical protein